MRALPNGTLRLHPKGYYHIKLVDHPLYGTGWFRRNRVVLGEKLGRRLEPHEDAHHINEIKTDDHPDNLELKDHGQHSREHKMGNVPWNKGQSAEGDYRTARQKALLLQNTDPKYRDALLEFYKESLTIR